MLRCIRHPEFPYVDILYFAQYRADLTRIKPPLGLGDQRTRQVVERVVLKGTKLLGTVVVLKGLAEFAGLLLIGQGLVYALSFGRHEVNGVYRLFRLMTSPVVRLTRIITPQKVADKHVPFVALILIFWIWLFLSYFKYSMMLGQAA